MTTETALLLALLMGIVALLYSSVGHGGASGYLAVMGLLGVSPAMMKPTALVLNLLVASVASVQFARAGHFRGRLFLLFALGSVPLALLGGTITLPVQWYKPLVGVVLLYSASRLFTKSAAPDEDEVQEVPPSAGVVGGAIIGLLSGLTGTGGGIFLSPLLLSQKWATLRQAAGVACVFILVNSSAGLAGHLSKVRGLPSALPLWGVAVLIGGTIGAYYGSSRLPVAHLKRLLAAVLLLAGTKLLLGG